MDYKKIITIVMLTLFTVSAVAYDRAQRVRNPHYRNTHNTDAKAAIHYSNTHVAKPQTNAKVNNAVIN